MVNIWRVYTLKEFVLFLVPSPQVTTTLNTTVGHTSPTLHLRARERPGPGLFNINLTERGKSIQVSTMSIMSFRQTATRRPSSAGEFTVAVQPAIHISRLSRWFEFASQFDLDTILACKTVIAHMQVSTWLVHQNVFIPTFFIPFNKFNV